MSTPAAAPKPQPWSNVPKAEVARLCLAAGPLLDPYLAACTDPQGERLRGSQLLWALAGCESTFGENCKPRPEAAYAPGGRYYRDSFQQRELWRLFGPDAAQSYSPWQILPCNAPGFTPEQLGSDPAAAVRAVIGHLRRYVLGARAAKTLEDILDTYNSGTWRDEVSPGVARYIRDGIHYYTTEVIDNANPANPLG